MQGGCSTYMSTSLFSGRSASKRTLPMAEPICLIPGNPDIAGIGVRAAAYIQAILAALIGVTTLCILHMRWLTEQDRMKSSGLPGDLEESTLRILLQWYPKCLRGPEEEEFFRGLLRRCPPSLRLSLERELHVLVKVFSFRAPFDDSTKTLERSIFMIGSTLIISTFIELRTSGISPYHALIVLNISIINNFAGTLTVFARGGIFKTPGLNFVWSMVHSALVGAFGLYFWSKPGAFLDHVPTDGPPCKPMSDFWLFVPISSTSTTLKRGSLAFYAITTIPFWNHLQLVLICSLVILVWGTVLLTLAGVFRCFLTPIIALFYCCFLRPIIGLFYCCFLRPIIAHFIWPFRDSAWMNRASILVRRPSRQVANLLRPAISSYPVIVCRLSLIFMPPLLSIIFMIVSTEEIVKLHSPHLTERENNWTYGQTLALCSALVSTVLYMYEWGKLWTKRRQKREETKGDQESLGDQEGVNKDSNTPPFYDYLG